MTSQQPDGRVASQSAWIVARVRRGQAGDMDQIVIGVDTHKSNHVAVTIAAQVTRLGPLTAPTTRVGCRGLEAWARGLGSIKAFGIEGTGSYGAGLSRDLQAKGHIVLDIMRPNRKLGYLHGRSDSLDAEIAARLVLNGRATPLAKTQSGASEMIRHIKIARDSAVKAKSLAMIALKTWIKNVPTELRDNLDQIRGPITLVRHIAVLRPGKITSPTASTKAAMRAMARRWLCLHEEIQIHEQEPERMVGDKAPEVMKSHGISTLTVAEMLILVGDNPERIRSDATLAKMCGVCPIPTSNGKTNRMHLNRGGSWRANAALYRVAIMRMRNHTKTRAYAARRSAEGKTRREIVRCNKR